MLHAATSERAWDGKRLNLSVSVPAAHHTCDGNLQCEILHPYSWLWTFILYSSESILCLEVGSCVELRVWSSLCLRKHLGTVWSFRDILMWLQNSWTRKDSDASWQANVSGSNRKWVCINVATDHRSGNHKWLTVYKWVGLQSEISRFYTSVLFWTRGLKL